MIRITVDSTFKTLLDGEGRIDPLLHEKFQEGDSVAQCPSCSSWMLAQSWDDLGGVCACSYKPKPSGETVRLQRTVAVPTTGARAPARNVLARIVGVALLIALIFGVINVKYNNTCTAERSQLQQFQGTNSIQALVDLRGVLRCREVANILEEAITTTDGDIYRAARGNIDQLRAYSQSCAVCNYRTAANNEIRELEEPVLRVRVKSNHPDKIGLTFYSRTRNVMWQFDAIQDYGIHDYSMSCLRNESICYGAWVEGTSFYWGVGRDGREGCTSCCLVCPGERSTPFVLDRRDLRVKR